jgi:hypothetical protein
MSTIITVVAETMRTTIAREDDVKKRKEEIDREVGREIAKNVERRRITTDDATEVARETEKIGNIADDIREL